MYVSRLQHKSDSYSTSDSKSNQIRQQAKTPKIICANHNQLHRLRSVNPERLWCSLPTTTNNSLFWHWSWRRLEVLQELGSESVWSAGLITECVGGVISFTRRIQRRWLRLILEVRNLLSSQRHTLSSIKHPKHSHSVLCLCPVEEEGQSSSSQCLRRIELKVICWKKVVLSLQII